MLKPLCVAIAFLCLIAPSAHAQPSAREALVGDYIAAFNQGDEAMQRFFETRAGTGVPVETRLQRYRQMRGDFGTLTLRRIVSSEAETVTAEIAGSSGAAGTFVFSFAPGTVVTLQGIAVRIGGPSGPGGPGGGDEVQGAGPLPARDERAAVRDIAALVAAASAADAFSGAVLVARGGTTVWETATGLASVEQKVANTSDTRFNVGSIGKILTAVAVAQLVAAGKVRPDDVVGRFLPDYPNETVRSTVTVQMLLDMRSGLGDFFGPNYEKTPRSQLRSLEDYVPLFAGDALRFAPGQGQQYSNAGYVLLGLIVQHASGMSYYDYIQTRVFDVAGMRDSGFFLQSAPTPRRANGYTTRLGPTRQINTTTLPERASSAGGVYSTTHDLLRFEQALASGKLVAATDMQRIGRSAQGMGIAGGAPGLNATLDQDVNGYTVVVMSNYDPPSAERLARDVRRVLASVK